MQAQKTTARAGDNDGASSEDDRTSRRDDGTSSDDDGDYSPVVTDDSDTAEQESIPLQKKRKLDQSKRYLEGITCRPYRQTHSTSDSTSFLTPHHWSILMGQASPLQISWDHLLCLVLHMHLLVDI